VHEETTENAEFVKPLFCDLIERGLPTDRVLLFLTDGVKALRPTITGLFGKLALIKRCRVHKEHTVLEHLPEEPPPGVRRTMRDA